MASGIIPVTESMLVGRLKRELSYQYAEECANRTKRLHKIAQEAAENKTVQRKNMKFLGAVPMREFFRIRQQHDPHFFRDRKNVYKLIKDNPELKGGVGV